MQGFHVMKRHCVRRSRSPLAAPAIEGAVDQAGAGGVDKVVTGVGEQGLDPPLPHRGSHPEGGQQGQATSPHRGEVGAGSGWPGQTHDAHQAPDRAPRRAVGPVHDVGEAGLFRVARRLDAQHLGRGVRRRRTASRPQECFAAAAGTLTEGDSGLGDAVVEYAQRFVARGRTPADERLDAWRSTGSALLAEDAERVAVMAR